MLVSEAEEVRGNSMRAIISFLVGILSMGVVLGFGVLVAQNGQTAHVDFLGLGLDADAGWLWAAAAVIGFALAVLLLIPGRLAGAWRGRSLNRQAGALETQLAALQRQYAQLHGDHERLLAEHQQLLEQVTVATPGHHPWTPGAIHAEPAPSEPESTGLARVWSDARARFQAGIQGIRARFHRHPKPAVPPAEHEAKSSGDGETPTSAA
jgi:hypothetical protein